MGQHEKNIRKAGVTNSSHIVGSITVCSDLLSRQIHQILQLKNSHIAVAHCCIFHQLLPHKYSHLLMPVTWELPSSHPTPNNPCQNSKTAPATSIGFCSCVSARHQPDPHGGAQSTCKHPGIAPLATLLARLRSDTHHPSPLKCACPKGNCVAMGE